jgi:DNA repair exonuclease SbcCD nuclease subunit
MKLLITADIHVHKHRDDSRRLEDGLECLEWIYATAVKEKVEKVVVAGDLFHNRFQHNAYGYSKVANIIQHSKVPTILLVGNHDMLYEENWDVHSLIPFRKFAQVIEKPTTLDLGCPIDFLPYTPTPSKYLPTFNPSRVLISHLAIANAIMNAKYDIKSVEEDCKDREIINVDAFKSWEKVFLGHYHYGQRLCDNLEYVGSPMQLTFGEADQKKCVVIFDTITFETRYIENPVSPRFYIVENIVQLDHIDLKRAYIHIRTMGDIANKFDIRKRLEEGGIRELEFTPIKKDLEDKTAEALINITKVVNDRAKLVETFIDNIQAPPGLEKLLLKKHGKEVFSTS